MSYKQMTGNIISATKVEPDGKFTDSAASGVWNLQDAYDYTRGANWPNAANLNTRAIFSGGASNNVTIDFINISSAGNATDFGDLIVGTYGGGSVGSTTRGVIGGAASANTIQYVTFASTGNSQDFGDLSTFRVISNAGSNVTRGLFFAGTAQFGSYTRVDTVDYITIANTGNATDFGNLIRANAGPGAGFASTTRAIYGGGAFGGGTSRDDSIDYFTIASAGNGTDFGNLSAGNEGVNGCSSNTRGLFAGGYTAGGDVINVIEYITIANTGNTTDFGDLTATTSNCNGSTSNSTTGVINVTGNVLDFVTIASTGNAADFGDLTVARSNRTSATSGSHGGIAA